MTCTFSSFVPEIRSVLRDESVPYHVSDGKVMLSVRDAFVHMWSVRPDSRYVDGRLYDVVFPADSELPSFSVSFDARWRLGIVYFAASRCYENDITDSVNMQLADTLLKKADSEFFK